MKDKGCSRVEVCLSVANVIGVCAIVIIAAAIGTDKWVVFSVDQSRLTAEQLLSSKKAGTGRYYNDRTRGMFRECYPGNKTTFLDDSADVIDKNCFGLTYVDNTEGTSAEYKLMLGLYTSFMAMFVIAEVVFVVAYILGLCLCVRRHHTQACYASIFCFIAAFLLALGMALFHASIFVEREQVTDTSTAQLYYQRWPAELKNATTRMFKESYIAAWCGLVLTAVTAICYGLAAKFMADKQHQRRNYPEKAYRDPYFYDNPQYALEPYHPKVIPMDHPAYSYGRQAYYEAPPRPMMYADEVPGYRIRELQQ